ncbi:hypothetical protein N8I74_08885 [Chitiniphilus purpureus]|uniref:ABC-type transport auxiliary lipoprotein component domain-containing protein n=1 Tax=Chitiniphilus purpureus TaxID=2981137 RepID=A0ABY6DTP6_9NEIS|nr:hypothetical protein [Chitiniphilus sp. CD1]UXY17108.1 hypothetical protein N8I74_08885 [Chitiniphilus sp. CD1]
MKTPLAALIALPLLLGQLAGCAGNPPPPESRYRIEAARPAAPAAAPLAQTLRLAPLRAAEGYREWRFVYRESDYRYAVDPYRGFVAAPAQLVTERTRAWLAASGLFGQIVSETEPADDPWVLHGRVDAFYADLRPGKPQQVTVQLTFTLHRDGSAAAQWPAHGQAPIRLAGGEGIAAAADEALANALTQLEQRLRATDLALVR